jgi:hypothetical protein
MKRTALTLTALALTLSLTQSAQKIEWGPKLTMKKSYSPVILGEDDNYFYSTSSISAGAFKLPELDVEKFDKSTRQRVFVQKLDLRSPDKNKKDQILEDIVFTGENFVTFHSYFDKKADEMVIYANLYSTENGKQIAREKNIINVPVEKKRRRGSFAVSVSENGKRLLISHLAYYKKQDKMRERMILLDEKLQKITEREDVTEGRTANVGVKGLALDNDGSFYYEQKLDGGQRKIVTYDASKDYEKWEETINLKKVGLPVTGEIYNMSVATTRKKDLVLAGYYSRTGENLDGTYFLKIDGRSKEIVAQKLNDFDQAFKDQFKTKRDIKKNREGKVGNYQFGKMKLYKKDDGGLVGVGEIKWHYITYDRNGVPASENYYFGDMIAINLENDGNMTWAHRMKKAQTFRYARSGPFIFSSVGMKMFTQSFKPLDYMSYFAALGKDKFYVAFNDNSKNLQKKSDQDKLALFKKPTEAVMSIYTIDLATGEKKKSAFFGGKDFSITVEPGTAYQSKQSSQPIIMGSRKKDFKFGLMQLD